MCIVTHNIFVVNCLVVVVGIDPTSSAYEAGAHPSTPYNLNRFGVTTGNRTQTKRITISVANRYNIATPKQFTICKHTNEPGCGIRTHVSPVAPAVLLRYRLMCLHIDTTYKNTFNFSSMLAQRTFRHCQVTETVTASICGTCPVKNVYVYGRGTESRTLIYRLKAGYSSHWIIPPYGPCSENRTQFLRVRAGYFATKV